MAVQDDGRDFLLLDEADDFGGVVGRDQQDFVDPPLKQHPEILTLFGFLLVGVAQQHHVPGRAGGVFHAPRDGREKGVRDIREDQRQRVGAARAQAARQTVGDIAQIVNSGLDTLADRLGDVSRVIDHAGDRHRGDTRAFGDVLDCGHGLFFGNHAENEASTKRGHRAIRVTRCLEGR